ncbi:MAG: DUF427 domain-containing protein, partial [Gemmatimonadetes bacterium]|nr:DUF427 domain-containing protein [Gemmatimonadota bacterium]
DYPRPPRIEPTGRRLRVEFNGSVVAETERGFRVLETSHPPVYFFPPEDVTPGVLVASPGNTFCEWKGAAVYHDVAVGDRVAARAAWSYPVPTPDARDIAGYVAFYARRMHRCTVDGRPVTPQPGAFYGGWITDDLVGPFKGSPGTEGW